MTANNSQPQGQQLTPQQIQVACQAGVQLIAQGRLDCPSDMAMNGTLGVLNGVLTALAQGSAVMVAPQMIEELQANQKVAPKPTKKVAKKVAKKKVAKKKVSKKK